MRSIPTVHLHLAYRTERRYLTLLPAKLFFVVVAVDDYRVLFIWDTNLKSEMGIV